MVDAEEFADWMHPGHGQGAFKKHDSLRVALVMVIIFSCRECCLKEIADRN